VLKLLMTTIVILTALSLRSGVARAWSHHLEELGAL
jgi:hypothetical protein